MIPPLILSSLCITSCSLLLLLLQVEPVDALSNQLVGLVAENAAIEDALYHLDQVTNTYYTTLLNTNETFWAFKRSYSSTVRRTAIASDCMLTREQSLTAPVQVLTTSSAQATLCCWKQGLWQLA
jgi:Vps23 core domain